MLQLSFEVDSQPQEVQLIDEVVRIGRAHGSDVQLADYSVSRRHAVIRRQSGAWLIEDLGSTNGVEINGTPVLQAVLSPGDEIGIGIFTLRVTALAGSSLPLGEAGTHPVLERRDQDLPGVGDLTAWGAFEEPSTAEDLALAHATIVRSLSSFTADYGLAESAAERAAEGSSATRKRRALDQAYASNVFGFLTRLARLLITAEEVDEVLEHVMAIAFEALPVDRGFIMLGGEGSVLECALMRTRNIVVRRPREDVPVSTTMLEAVMRERVALLTYDALSDQRLATQQSIEMHQIRAAMCAPLWSGERIIGVIQVDSPHSTGSFTEQDVDFLTALANYCAVAVERLENAARADAERQARSRLARYHSPAVVESVLRDSDDNTDRRLRPAIVSVLFADVVGFTSFAEDAEPEQVATMMTAFFTRAVTAIFETGGTLDKFIGDCVMAFFGAPLEQPDHALRAVDAAVRMQRAVVEMNDTRRQDGLPEMPIRIGINSGPVVVGDIGSDRRVDYTVLGNTVNVASRLESAAAPGQVVIGNETLRLLENAIPTEALGTIELRGLSRGVEAHRVLLEQLP